MIGALALQLVLVPVEAALEDVEDLGERFLHGLHRSSPSVSLIGLILKAGHLIVVGVHAE
jgi:hypothetical protein